MQQIPLNAVPNQDLDIQLDGAYWRIKLYLSMGFVCADVSRDGESLITGVRCFLNQPLLPYSYLYEPLFGNFLFDNDVDWENFNGSCSLYYLDAEEYREYKELTVKGYAQSAIKTLKSRAAKFAAEAASVSWLPSPIVTTIVSQPQDHATFVGDNISFLCGAQNWVSVDWEYSPVKSGAAWRVVQSIVGGAAGILKIDPIEVYHAGFYRAVVYGSDMTVTSNEVELRVV